ncbi:MAG TPA: hypothetical protein VGM14_05480 [Streptosporangiaceae bacterium]
MRYLAQSASRRLLCAAGLAGATALVSTAMTASIAQAAPTAPAIHYSFKTVNNNNDPTFNQLLGINDAGKIAGYFGSGAKGHPNKGYTLKPPYHQVDFRNQNFPGSKQTQVTGLNNGDIQVGFYSTMNTKSGNNNNFGFYSINGKHFHKVNFPTKNPASPPVDQLLGVNDSGLAVGFYLDAKGNSHGYLYDIPAHKYVSENPPLGTGVTSVTPTGINDPDSVCGFFTNSGGTTKGFLIRKASPHLFILKVPGSDATMPFGVNKFGLVDGVYTKGSKNFGFTWDRKHGYQTVKDPNGPTQTFVNGVNSAGDLVGFYVDRKGNTDGFIAKP